MTVKFEVQGLAALDKAVRQLPKNIQKRVMKTALRAGGRVIAKEAKQNVPVGTGDLKKSIKIVTGKSKKDGALIFVTTTKDAFYSHMIEFGTSKMKAQPFLRPAFDSTQKEVMNAIGNKLGEGIIKETAKL